ncbi:hypothetical protein [Litorihabitans aurantiacus]|uniref:HEPN domain-containing protein n=1 Tax=Litorihabitans aurantiacus TaxID=1930061 RepID=A0AA37XG22_9MICO|nr:hypothetical protein [Litorihabitans aurantiacus]GMA32627.1 hypothetical protein GCM10025875_26190 [Litorihabitans aurantiacus]
MIERLLADGELQQVVGAASDGVPLLARASRTLLSAEALATTDADSAYVLAYDAARQALSAVLQQEGLRPTSRGGHLAVERAAVAQFGDGMRPFAVLRRRRNELEYPQVAGDAATVSEVDDAPAEARRIVDACGDLLGSVGIF